jgi:hypothetical protein
MAWSFSQSSGGSPALVTEDLRALLGDQQFGAVAGGCASSSVRHVARFDLEGSHCAVSLIASGPWTRHLQ